MHLLWDILNEYWSNENRYEYYYLSQVLFDEIINREKFQITHIYL